MFGINLSPTEIAEHYAEHCRVPFQKVYDLVMTNPSTEEFEYAMLNMMGEKSKREWMQRMCREHEPINVGFNLITMACKHCDMTMD